MSKRKKNPKHNTRHKTLTPARARLALLVTLAVFVCAIFGVLYLSNIPHHVWRGAENLTARMGFAVHDGMVVGRAQVDRNELMQQLAVQKGDPMIGFNLRDASVRLKTITWINEARIEKRWPNKIIVQLTERVPLALWQRKGQLSLIDRDGQVLDTKDLTQFQKLPVLVGDTAPAHASPIFYGLLKYPDLYKQVSALSWIGDRRWDIYLKNNIIIKLGEVTEDFSINEQLASLQQMQAQQNLFDRNIAVIDLRLPDRVIVQTKTETDTADKKSAPKI